MSNLHECRDDFDDEEIEKHWNPAYENIEDVALVKKILLASEILNDNQQVHVFCQRAVQDLTDAIVPADGRMSTETIDAINFTIKSGLAKQLRMTVSHYVINYIQIHVNPSEYGKYLKKLFD